MSAVTQQSLPASHARSHSSHSRPYRGGFRNNRSYHKNRDYRPRYNQSSTSRSRAEGEHEQAIPGAFFLGNVDKQLTREEVYDFIKNNTRCYIKKFDMPNVLGGEFDKEGRAIRCAGFAFVHVKHQWMADEMLERGKIRIGNLDAEIKPYDVAKREMSEKRHRAASGCLERESAGNEGMAQEEEHQRLEIVAQSQSTPRTKTAHNNNNSDYTGTQDWTQEEQGDYNPHNDWSQKIINLAGDGVYVEDDSLYQTEDETASVMSSQIQNVNIIEPSSIYSSRAASPPAGPNQSQHAISSSQPIRRRPQNKISLNRNDNEIVGEITTKLIEEGITPTADKINEIASKDYQIQQKVVTDQKHSSQETVVQQQQNQVVQTPLSIGIPQPPQQAYVLPSTHLPFLMSPLHQTVELLANQLVITSEYNAMIYETLVQQWQDYFYRHPDQVYAQIQRTEYEQRMIMEQTIGNYNPVVPQNII